MNRTLTFKVEIEGLEDKIWREIEISDKSTVADLAYTILATFKSLAYHLYFIKYKAKIYDCWVCIEDDIREVPPINAIITELNSLNLKGDDTMEMEYDAGSPTIFKITCLSSKKTKASAIEYPQITDGQGSGMIDDITNDELKEVVENIDKLGKSKYYTLCPDGKSSKIYDYRNFNLDENKIHVKKYFPLIKKAYENPEN